MPRHRALFLAILWLAIVGMHAGAAELEAGAARTAITPPVGGPVSTYTLALDGDKVACRVRTSNAGHCLFTGIASPERALRLGKPRQEDCRTVVGGESWSFSDAHLPGRPTGVLRGGTRLP